MRPSSFFFQAEDGIRDYKVTGVQRVLFRSREHLTPELRLLVMSATLDGAAVARLLEDAPLITAHGRIFPVQTRYAGKGLPGLSEAPSRSEERRVGKECRSRWSPYH